MGERTKIEWCDSTFNLQMGCNGCELWNADRKTCYAGIMTERMQIGGGNVGFPKRFEEPTLFLDRLRQITRWQDLTGQSRGDKPWLDGLPRFVFLNDMGDTFTEGLDVDWLARTDQYDDDLGRKLDWESPLQIMADTPHFYLLLTKRPSRAARFTMRHGPLPDNFMVMTSVTSQANARRMDALLEVDCKWRGLSIEPLLGPIKDFGFDLFNWVIVGGESGKAARAMNPDWARSVRDQCVAADVPFFFKQWGEFAPPEPISHYSHKHPQMYYSWKNGSVSPRVGKKRAGRTLDGRQWNQVPRIAEVPA